MERIPEPELMESEAQAIAYAQADFEQAHSGIVSHFKRVFPDAEIDGSLLDLGCGPGDIAFRFARMFPDSYVVGVDGSRAMLDLAEKRATAESLNDRVSFVRGSIPDVQIPSNDYQAIVSNSLLHHLHDPMVLWETLKKHSRAGTRVFIADLMRPGTVTIARELRDKYSEGEPEVLKRDFYNSLRAAFEVVEVKKQLEIAGLSTLEVEPISDRHLLIWGNFSGTH